MTSHRRKNRGTKKIALRIPERDYAIIEHKALESHLSLNQYLIRCGCDNGVGGARHLTDLMGRLGRLYDTTQRAKELPQLKEDVFQWRDDTMALIERMA